MTLTLELKRQVFEATEVLKFYNSVKFDNNNNNNNNNNYKYNNKEVMARASRPDAGWTDGQAKNGQTVGKIDGSTSTICLPFEGE